MIGDIPIPDRMKHLPRDRRGYPIPVIVAVKDGDKPTFSVNDMDLTARCIGQDRCTVCGGKLFRGRWLVGGGMSALSPRGHFADAPAHEDCTHYALKVCPYLAAPNWRTPVGKLQAAAAGIGITFDLENVADNTRPVAFVAVMASRIEIHSGGIGAIFCRPKEGHVQRVEVWRQGQQLFGDDLAAFRAHAAEKVEKFGGVRPDIWALMGGERSDRDGGKTRGRRMGHASNATY